LFRLVSGREDFSFEGFLKPKELQPKESKK